MYGKGLPNQDVGSIELSRGNASGLNVMRNCDQKQYDHR